MSCHAAEVEGFALEGHVPAAAIRRLLAERPPGVRGLAVPGMPVGSPGMEVPGVPSNAYDVIAFGTGPQRPFIAAEATAMVPDCLQSCCLAASSVRCCSCPASP